MHQLIIFLSFLLLLLLLFLFISSTFSIATSTPNFHDSITQHLIEKYSDIHQSEITNETFQKKIDAFKEWADDELNRGVLEIRKSYGGLGIFASEGIKAPKLFIRYEKIISYRSLCTLDFLYADVEPPLNAQGKPILNQSDYTKIRQNPYFNFVLPHEPNSPEKNLTSQRLSNVICPVLNSIQRYFGSKAFDRSQRNTQLMQSISNQIMSPQSPLTTQQKEKLKVYYSKLAQEMKKMERVFAVMLDKIMLSVAVAMLKFIPREVFEFYDDQRALSFQPYIDMLVVDVKVPFCSFGQEDLDIFAAKNLIVGKRQRYYEYFYQEIFVKNVVEQLDKDFKSIPASLLKNIANEIMEDNNNNNKKKKRIITTKTKPLVPFVLVSSNQKDQATEEVDDDEQEEEEEEGINLKKYITFDNFMWGQCTILSRYFDFDDSVSLVPVLDLINHKRGTSTLGFVFMRENENWLPQKEQLNQQWQQEMLSKVAEYKEQKEYEERDERLEKEIRLKKKQQKQHQQLEEEEEEEEEKQNLLALEKEKMEIQQQLINVENNNNEEEADDDEEDDDSIELVFDSSFLSGGALKEQQMREQKEREAEREKLQRQKQKQQQQEKARKAKKLEEQLRQLERREESIKRRINQTAEILTKAFQKPYLFYNLDSDIQDIATKYFRALTSKDHYDVETKRKEKRRKERIAQNKESEFDEGELVPFRDMMEYEIDNKIPDYTLSNSKKQQQQPKNEKSSSSSIIVHSNNNNNNNNRFPTHLYLFFDQPLEEENETEFFYTYFAQDRDVPSLFTNFGFVELEQNKGVSLSSSAENNDNDENQQQKQKPDPDYQCALFDFFYQDEGTTSSLPALVHLNTSLAARQCLIDVFTDLKSETDASMMVAPSVKLLKGDPRRDDDDDELNEHIFEDKPALVASCVRASKLEKFIKFVAQESAFDEYCGLEDESNDGGGDANNRKKKKTKKQQLSVVEKQKLATKFVKEQFVEPYFKRILEMKEKLDKFEDDDEIKKPRHYKLIKSWTEGQFDALNKMSRIIKKKKYLKN